MNGLPIISTMLIAKNKTGPSTFVKTFSDVKAAIEKCRDILRKVIESIERNKKVLSLIFIAWVMGLLIWINRQSIEETDVTMSRWLLPILSILYFIACGVSLHIAEKTPETKIWDRHILVIGASIAYIFSVSASPSYDITVIDLMTIAVRLEVLLLAIGVPLAYNATVKHSETSIDKDTKKHYGVTELPKHSETSVDKDAKNHSEVIKLLKNFVRFSVIIIILLLYQLSIFNFNENDTIGSHIFLGVPIEDVLLISISIFLFICSLFLFVHIIFRLIDIFSMSALKEKRKEGLKQAIRKGDKGSIKENCDNLNGDDVADVMREMIEKEIDGADDALLCGMHYLTELKRVYLREHPETLVPKLLWDRVENRQGRNAKRIKSLLEKEFSEITKPRV